MTNFSVRLKSDPELRSKVEAIKREVVHTQSIADYAQNIGTDLKSWLSNDLQQPDSKVREKISAAVAGLGTTLSLNRGLKESLNEHLESLVLHYGDTLRTAIAGHISGTVQKWESDDYVSEIELSIGSDLQFIRMNGTLVGGVIGLLLHARCCLRKLRREFPGHRTESQKAAISVLLPIRSRFNAPGQLQRHPPWRRSTAFATDGPLHFSLCALACQAFDGGGRGEHSSCYFK